MKLAQRLFVLLLAVQAIPAADSVLTNFLPPGAKIVVGVHVRSLLDSAVTQGALAKAQSSGGDWLKAVPLVGFDPLKDLDEVLLTTNGEGQNPPTLVIASGRFDLARLSEGAQRYKDIALLGADKSGDGVIALIDANTALAGDRPMVLAAIDRIGGDARIESGLAERIATLRGQYDVWGLGDKPEGLMTGSTGTNGLDSIDRFQFGMSLHAGLELGAEIHARTAQDVEKLNATLGTLGAMMKGQTSSGTKFDLKAEDGTFKLALSVPEEELKKAIQAQSGLLAKAMESQTTPAKPAIPVTTEGWDGGAQAQAAPAPAVVSEAIKPAPVAAPVPPSVEAPKPAPVAAPRTANGASVVLDKEGNTVVVRLPGAKK